jgi:hypothetical protein
MTYEEVKAVMGKPTKTGKEDAEWSDEDGVFFVSFDGTVKYMRYHSSQNFLMEKFRQLSDLFLD